MASLFQAQLLAGWLVLSSLALSGAAQAETKDQATPQDTDQSSAQEAAQRLDIIRVTPSGNDVPAEKQLVITFNRPVVPLGRMERAASELPITITPSLHCSWRWIDTSSLACNLPDKAALQWATRYTLDVEPGIKAEDGTTLEAPYHATFLTERPVVSDNNFYLWKSPTLPVVRLVFNQPVLQSSVAQHIFLNVGEGSPERMAVAVSADPADRELPMVMTLPDGSGVITLKKPQVQKSDDQLTQTPQGEARRVWLVEPKAELKGDSAVAVMAEPGLISAWGLEPGADSAQILNFRTFPAFAFRGVNCTDNGGNAVHVEAGQAPSGKCNPMRPVSLAFSVPVDRDKVSELLTFTPPITGWPQAGAAVDQSGDEEETGDEGGSAATPAPPSGYEAIGYEFKRPHAQSDSYEVYLPGPLKAALDYHVKSTAAPLKDIFDRPLQGSIDQQFNLDHRNPNFVLDYSDAVLEKGVDSDVPFYVNNLKSFGFDYRKLTPQGSAEGLSMNTPVPNVEDLQWAMPFGIRQMLNGGTGAVYGLIKTNPGIGSNPPRLFAQVTPYQVHVKLGHFNTLVWVTDMATGKPVADARVLLFKDKLETLHQPTNITAEVVTDQQGVTQLPGTDVLDPDLTLTTAYGDDKERYFLQVIKNGDMALVPVSQAYIIDNYRATGSDSVYPSNREVYGHMQAWGTTAQGIYRVGDRIQYKIFVRNQDKDRLIPPPLNGYSLMVTDPMGKVVYKVKTVKLSAFGGAAGEFIVPKEGAVGWYNFKLYARFAKGSGEEYSATEAEGSAGEGDAAADTAPEDNLAGVKSWTAMRVLVSDFTPAPFKVSNQLNGDLFHANDNVEATSRAELFAGGAYTNASTRITALLSAAPFTSPQPALKDFTFGSLEGEEASQQIFQTQAMINDKGELTLSFPMGTPKIVFGKLSVESAVADDRGKFIASLAHADYIGVDRLVGLRPKGWMMTVGQPAGMDYVATDEHGAAIAGTDVAITIDHEVVKAARVKGAGNAYLTEYATSWEKAGDCKGTSETQPLTCNFTPTSAGSYRFTAVVTDTKGRSHQTRFNNYAAGPDYVMWDTGSDSSLAIIPQSTSYKVGETAHYLVKNPYPGADALITVERYGVIDHFVQTLASSTPVIDLKIKPDYVPGFYLSVTIISPRVEKPLQGQVDLGKPTFRMGYVVVPVSDPYKEMVVTAQTDKDVYKPRDTVKVTLHAEPRAKDNGQEPVELTVVVLDESVLALISSGVDYFNAYAGFYKLEAIDLRNYSLLTRLVGRQRFEKKGANPGGDGGVDVNMRSLFKFVSYWNAELKTDENGNATISFDAPDNLTGWRVLALASTPTDRFGLGQGNFKVNKPTEIRPVMPNQVKEGDFFNAGFSVMNRTDKPRTLDVKITAKGGFDTAKTPAVMVKSVHLDPFKREIVFMPIATMPGGLNKIKGGQIEFAVTAGDAADRDGLIEKLTVTKSGSLELAANYGTTIKDLVSESLLFPKEMIAGSGSVSVVVSPTVIGNIAGAFKYMEFYPYLCWEQRLSKAVMAAHFKELSPYLPKSLKWAGAESLPKETLNQASSFQAPNGGMAYFRAQDDYTDPYLSAFTAIAFNWLRSDGYQVPEQVESKLQDYLINLLKNDAVPSYYSANMTSTVRAVALAALAQRGKADLADIERYRPFVKYMSLLGKSYFLQATLAVEGGEKYAPEVSSMILAMSNQTGGKFVFQEAWDDSYSRILASPMRENCAVLDAFTAYAKTAAGKQQVGDVPFRLVRTITQSRKRHDYWENTQENMFCGNALIDYARVYEAEPVAMEVRALIDNKPLGKTSFKDVRNPSVTFSKANAAEDAGRNAIVQIAKQGTGRLYYATRLTYGLPANLSKPANAGIDITREYSVERAGKWQLLSNPAQIKRGELVRVDLFLSVPAARNFVVVDDPVPGGLEPVNRDLATASTVDADKGDFTAGGGSIFLKYSDWIGFDSNRWSFYHQELRHDAVRYYSDYLPPGNYHLSYVAQAIATGSFAAMPTMAQEMYDPDVFGKTSAVTLEVGEQATQPALPPQ